MGLSREKYSFTKTSWLSKWHEAVLQTIALMTHDLVTLLLFTCVMVTLTRAPQLLRRMKRIGKMHRVYLSQSNAAVFTWGELINQYHL